MVHPVPLVRSVRVAEEELQFTHDPDVFLYCMAEEYVPLVKELLESLLSMLLD